MEKTVLYLGLGFIISLLLISYKILDKLENIENLAIKHCVHLQEYKHNDSIY